MDNRSKIDCHQTLLDRCTTLISACDNKASLALAFVGVILGMAVSQISNERIIDCLISEHARYAALIFLMLSCTLFLLTIRPQGKLKIKDNFILDRMNSIDTEDKYLKELQKQISESAGIYCRKCRYYRWGTRLLVVSLVLIFLSEVIPYTKICA